MISKECFCEIIRALQKSEESADRISDKIKAIFDEEDRTDLVYDSTFNNTFCDYTLEESIVYSLSKEFEPNVEDTVISYFVYELNFGKDYTPGCFTEDNIDIDISTPEKLYDYLVLQLN